MTPSAISFVLGLSLSGAVMFLIRRGHLHPRRAMSWIFLAAACLGLGFAPGFFDDLAARLDVAYPPTLAFCAALAALTLKMLSQDIARSKQDATARRLAQKLAQLEQAQKVSHVSKVS